MDRYVVQMRGNFSALRTAGADAAKQWGTSFYNYATDNLSPALISLLATLITPSVERATSPNAAHSRNNT